MADWYCDPSAVSSGAYSATPVAGGTAPTKPEDGNGRATGAATMATLVLQFVGIPTAGGTVTVAGVTFTAVASGATGNLPGQQAGQQLQCGLDLIQRERHNLLHPGVDMTRPTLHFLAALLLLATIAQLWADARAQPASAPTGAQPCGVGGTALRVGQGPVTLTDLQATEQRVRIGADGYWWTCETPAVMPPPREPAPCLLGRTPVEYLTWQVGAHQCRTDRAVHTGIAHGETRELRAIWGATVGQVRYHCVDGVARVIGEPACAPAPQQCTGRVTWAVAGVAYAYDGNTAPVPVGGRATATAQDGRTLTLTCRPGRRWGRL